MDDGSGKRFRLLGARPQPFAAFWLAMFVASAFGTVLGDFWAEGLHLGLVLSFGTLVVITGRVIWGGLPEGAEDRSLLPARQHW